MPTPISGTIKLSDIKNEFNNNGIGTIKLSDYYGNSTTGYTSGISGIPNIGTIIKFSDFYNKSIIITIPTIVANGQSATLINLSGNIYYYIFSLIGTNSITFSTSTVCEVLIVGGGGGGGGGFLGAGGAGGNIYYNNAYTFNRGTYNITIGTGGLGGIGYATTRGSAAGAGKSGNSTSITGTNTSLIANGGGGGTNHSTTNWNYAIGGSTKSTVVTNGTTVITNYTGGPGTSNFAGGFDGGGGAGAGQNGGVNHMCIGGNGYQSSITGTSIYYAGGGGGQGNIDKIYTDGLGFNNYGGGGHAGNADIDAGQPGKSGCVIIKFTFNIL